MRGLKPFTECDHYRNGFPVDPMAPSALIFG
jgi:hypothetical protein